MVDNEEEKRIEEIRNGASSIPETHVTHNLGPSTKVYTRLAFLKGLGTFFIGLSMFGVLLISWRLLDDNTDLREENACRFDISTGVNSIADNIDALTAEIFVEAIQNPAPPGTQNPEVTRIADELDVQLQALKPAIEARQASVETCRLH